MMPLVLTSKVPPGSQVAPTSQVTLGEHIWCARVIYMRRHTPVCLSVHLSVHHHRAAVHRRTCCVAAAGSCGVAMMVMATQRRRCGTFCSGGPPPPPRPRHRSSRLQRRTGQPPRPHRLAVPAPLPSRCHHPCRLWSLRSTGAGCRRRRRRCGCGRRRRQPQRHRYRVCDLAPAIT
jgi:hypothetical protein